MHCTLIGDFRIPRLHLAPARTTLAYIEMRGVFVAVALMMAVPAWAPPAIAAHEAAEPKPSNAPFRLVLQNNAGAARRASQKLAALAKQPAPAKLSTAERRLYADHTKWLNDASVRLAGIHARMEQVLAKGEKAPITEVATTNMELVNARDAIEAEAKRFNGLAKPAKGRHASALAAVRAGS
jgi:hypothetical protein